MATDAPTLAVVSFDGTSVFARWSAVAGASGYKVAVFTGDSPVYQGATTGTEARITVALDPNQAYDIRVRATAAGSQGPWSTAVPLVLLAPSGLATAVGADASVAAGWAAVAAVTGYRLALLDGQAEVTHVDVSTTSGSLPAPPDPHKTYTVRVCGLAGPGSISTGPWSEAATVILAAPQLTAVACDGQSSVSARWAAVTAPGVTGYKVAVFSGDTPVYQGATSGTEARITVALDPGKSYDIRVRATGAGSQGPWSTSVPLVLLAPSGLAISVAADASIAAGWAAVAAVTGYRLALFEAQTEVTHVDVSATSGSLPAPPDPGKTYTVRVCGLAGPGSISTGPWCDAVTVILAAPQLAAVACDGQSSVSARWAAVSAPGVTGYKVAIFTGDTPVYQGATSSTEARVTVALAPSKAYDIRVRATGPGSQGPWNPAIPLVLLAPSRLSISVGTDASIAAGWAAVAGVTGYRLALLDGQAEVTHLDVSTTSGSLPAPPDPKKTYTVRVCGLAGPGSISSGPWSDAVTVILSAPQLAAVACDGQSSVSARWAAVTAPGVTGYKVAIFSGDTPVYQGATSGTEARITVALDPNKAYDIQVRATGSGSQGPWSPAVPLVLLAPSGLSISVAADASIAAGWAAVAAATGYRLALLDGQAEVTHVDVSTTSGSLPAPPDPKKTYTVRVCGLAGPGSISTGPFSDAVTVILSAPQLAAVACDGQSSVSARWAAVTAPGVTGYKVAIFSGDTPVYQGATSGTEARITVALDPNKPYDIRVRATGPGSQGPWSPAVPLVLLAPANLSISVAADASIAAGWAALAAVTGYRLALFDAQAEVTHVDVSTTSGSLPAPPDPKKTYTVRVCGLAGPGSTSAGPWSDAVTVILSASQLTAVACDGQSSVSARWAAVAAPGVTGYKVAVFTGDSPVYQGATSGTEARITVALDPNKAYDIRVRATGPGSQGPWSPAVPLVLVAPANLAISVGADASIAAGWAALAAVTGYRLALFDAQAEVTHIDVSTTSGSLPAPPDPKKTYTVRVCGLAGPGSISTGPFSDAVTVILSAPQLAAVACDGQSSVSARWAAVTAPGVTGYKVAIFTGDSPVYQGATSGTEARITLALDPGKAYDIRVRATGAGSQGPWGGPVGLILVAPVIDLVFYDGSATIVGFHMPAAPGVTGVAGLVLVDGQERYRGSGAASPLTIPGALDAGHVNVVQAQAVGDRTAGPWSAPAAVLLDVPAGLWAATDGTHVTAAWRAVAGVDGYEAALAQDGAWGDPQAVAQTSIVFGPALASGVVYQVRVRTCQGIGRGPWTPPVPGPFLRAGTIQYDGLGRLTSLAFTGAGATTYEYDALGNITRVAVTAPAPPSQDEAKAG